MNTLILLGVIILAVFIASGVVGLVWDTIGQGIQDYKNKKAWHGTK